MSSKGVPERQGPLDLSLYRRTCARFATGITVVTVVDEFGRPHGMTVNSFSSVSLDPPLVLVSIDLGNAILGHFLSSPYFAINILAEHQQAIGKRFASRHINPFDGIEHRVGFNGSLIISEAAAYIECTTVAEIDVGTHTIFVGNIIGGDVSRARPLLYHDGKYKSVSPRLPDGDITASFFDV